MEKTATNITPEQLIEKVNTWTIKRNCGTDYIIRYIKAHALEFLKMFENAESVIAFDKKAAQVVSLYCGQKVDQSQVQNFRGRMGWRKERKGWTKYESSQSTVDKSRKYFNTDYGCNYKERPY